MSKFKFTALPLVLVLLAPIILTLQAQNAPTAPVPAQILNAKKVFISNASGDFEPGLWSGDSTRTYNEFYSAIKNQTAYQLVSAPSDADLILEIRLQFVHQDDENVLLKNREPKSQFILKVSDPKTQTVLWQFNEPFSATEAKKMRDINFSAGIDRLVFAFVSLSSLSNSSVK
jgi:hypothetical protein